jgi:tape measure domain-containing protein
VALKEAVVSLVLKAKNAISPEADPAAESLQEVQREAEKLEAELRELDKQQEAAKGWKAAQEAAEKARKEMDKQVHTYEDLKREGKKAGQSQAEYSVAVRQARTAQSIATTEYGRSNRELAKYSRTLDKAGIDTNELGQAEDRIQKELDQTQQKLSKATAEAREHAQALELASAKGNRFGSAVDGIKGKLLGLAAGVGVFELLRRGLEKLVTSGSDLEELERQFGALYGSMEEGRRVLAEVDRIAERNSQSLGDTAEAARRLKVAGIDPLNGSLQSLTDANAKYGSGAQTLDTVITQLGQAWQSGRLQLEELNSITDSGIPIMEALGNVTGRFGGEIRQMASDGLLGTDVLSRLIDELGRMSEGAGADRIDGARGLLSSLRKEFTDFFALASELGALDAIKVRMRELLTTLREMQKDGSIEEWAQGVSDSFRTTLNAIERFGSGFAIFWNGLTAGFRTGAAIWLAAIGSIAEGFSKLTGLIGAGDLSASLKEFADRAKGAAGELVDKVAEDGEDIKRHFSKAFLDSAESAEAAAERQKAASESTRKKINADLAALISKGDEASAKQVSASDRAARAARSKLGAALKELDLDLGKITDSMTELEKEAITKFQSINKQIAKAGLEGEQSAKVLLEAFQAALSAIESEEGGAALVKELDQAMKENILTQGQYAEAMREVAAATNDVLKRTKAATESAKKTTEQATAGENQKAQAAQKTTQAYQQQGQAAQEVGNKAQQGASKAGSAGAALLQIFTGIRQSFYDTGEGAGQLFDRLYKEQTDFAVLSIGTWLKTVYETKAAVQEQVTSAQENYDRAMARQGGNLNSFLRAASRAKQGAKLLGEEKLSTLKSAIESAKQQLDGLADSAASTTESLRTELINMNGTAQDIERRRFEERQKDLQRQMKAASEQGASRAAREYAEAMKINEQIYRQRVQDLKQEEVKAQADARQQRIQQAQGQASSQQATTQPNAPTQRVEIALPNGGTSSLAGDPDDVNRLMEFLNEAGMRATQ